ncbi:MAG: DUF1272 domain-containing protein [Bacteroidota bacterium]
MLAIRPTCEHCGKNLPYNATDAMICSFECTFCQSCVERVLKNVCPNCGGGFTPRPIRPRKELRKHPASNRRISSPIDVNIHQKLLAQYENTPPELR